MNKNTKAVSPFRMEVLLFYFYEITVITLVTKVFNNFNKL